MEINLKNWSFPGWVWVAIVVLIDYLAHKYVTDSLIVEGVTIVTFMVLKWQNIQTGDVTKLLQVIDSLVTQINDLKTQMPRRTPVPGEEVFRGGTLPRMPETTPRPIVRMNRGMKWMFD